MFKKKLDLLKASSGNRLENNFLFQMEKSLKTFVEIQVVRHFRATENRNNN